MTNRLTTVTAELELVKAARDATELEKEEKSIKVLILKFRKLSLNHTFKNRHRPNIGWGEILDPDSRQQILDPVNLPLPPSPPPPSKSPILTPSRLVLSDL